MKEAESVHDLIDMLHIDKIGRHIESVHNMIREGYEVKKYVVDSYEEFKEVVPDYYQYHLGAWMKAQSPFPADWAFDFALRILDTPIPDVRMSKVDGLLEKKGGFARAVNNARTGRNGGMVGVINDIAEIMKEQAVRHWVTGVFRCGVDPLDFDKRVAFMQEYQDHYGNLILDGDAMISPYEAAAFSNFELIIESHTRLVNEFRKFLQ